MSKAKGAKSLMQALKELGKSGIESGKATYGASKELAMKYPKSASAAGGVGAGTLLAAMLSGKSDAEKDAEAQEKRLKLSQMYGA